MPTLPPIILNDSHFGAWKNWTKMQEGNLQNLIHAGKTLSQEISLIEQGDFRALVVYVLAKAHPEFWTMPASSTGKHHPAFDNGPGGQVRHVRHMMVMALEGMRRYGVDDYPVDQRARMRDIVVFCCLLHDWAKNGSPDVWGDHTEARHPEIVADFLQNELFPNFKRVFGGNIGDEGELDFLLTHSILPLRHHMGQWGPSGVKPTDDILGPAALIIQEADFYSTRGFLGEFDESKWDEVLRRNSPAEIHREPK